MITIILSASFYSIIIIYSFNLLPYKWLSDYNTEIIDSPAHKVLSLPLYFFPVFTFTSVSIFLLSNSTHPLLQSSIHIAMILLLAHICLSDILYMIIPDQHIVLICFLGLFDISSQNIYYKVLGIFAGALPFFILLIVGIILKKGECIGFGDIKLMSALGFLLGYIDIFNIYIVSSLLSGVCYIILTLSSPLNVTKTKSTCLPFAPFISFASIFCMMS